MLNIASLPLLYRAAQRGVYGRHREFDSGSITDALFVYLNGFPSAQSTDAIHREYRGRPLVYLTEAWRKYIDETYPNAKIFTRYLMKPTCHFNLVGGIHLPDGFTAALYDEAAFDLHPFDHGSNYASFDLFRQNGAGAVVWHEDRIVSSASSFITLDSEVELDVSTEEEYRGKGLAAACISLMLQDCAKRGIAVHWDAQNETSRHLAEKFGFEQECCYSVRFLPQENHAAKE